MSETKENHLMVDIETLGNKQTSVITAIGAIEFSITSGECNRRFFERIDIQSALDIGLTVDGSTIEWWLAQSEHARQLIYGQKGKNIKEVLYLFRTFLQELGTENLLVWGNSARFDLGILNYTYNKINQDIPWYFRNERDVRTLVGFAPHIKKNMVFTGVEHDPLDDCRFQIQYCSEIYKTLNII